MEDGISWYYYIVPFMLLLLSTLIVRTSGSIGRSRSGLDLEVLVSAVWEQCVVIMAAEITRYEDTPFFSRGSGKYTQ